MGTAAFIQYCVERKVDGWVKEIEKLSNFEQNDHMQIMLPLLTRQSPPDKLLGGMLALRARL